MVKTARSTITLRAIEDMQKNLSELKALKDTVKDKRKLVPEAVKVFTGNYLERGEHTDGIYKRLVRFAELEIEAEWAKYLERFRQEQDRGNGQIAPAWPDEKD